MKKFIKACFCVLAIGGAWSVWAAEAPVTRDAKVVVLDIERAIMMTDVAQNKMKALENKKEYAETQKKAEGLRQQLIKKQEELQKEGPTWSADKRSNHLKDMDFMRKDFELVAQKLQADQQELMRELMRSAEPKINQALDELIKEQDISLVLHKSASVFSDRSLDMTESFVKKLNTIK